MRDQGPRGSSYDLLVIGGGINGLGIAADAAARGLSVLLVEKGDFGGGTTSASSRLIHGGLRYLQYGELALVRESLRERRILARRYPHLVRPLDLLIPSYRGAWPPAPVLGVGLALYDLLSHDPAFPRSRSLSPAAARQREPGLLAEGLAGGHLYPDAQVEFPERLCVALLRETIAAGGKALNHTRVVGLQVRSERVGGARLRDERTGEEREVEARVVVNAAGPWVDAVNRLLPQPPRRLIGGTWGSHLVLPRRPEGPREALYASAKKDGRPFFLLPWDGRLLVGTTDVPFDGDPDHLRVQEWEVEYLLDETNRLFPGARYLPADVKLTTIGVRPLPAAPRQRPGAITRRHFLVDHGREHGMAGLGSVVGGKLTTFRSLAAEVVDWVARVLQRPLPAPDPLPAGGWGQPLPSLDSHEEAAGAALAALGLPRPTASRLVRLYGEYWREVIDLARGCPALARPLAEGSAALAAEALHARDREQARTPNDILLRRLMLLPPSEAERRAVEELAARPV